MNEEHWFLPITPLYRVMFDSAAKLEGILVTGPSLHNDLPGILLRFGKKPVALSGEVSVIFCHVRLKPEDCWYDRYLWCAKETSVK